ncbi:heat-shock protein Hsp20 [Alkalilimnicola ehrlichii]|uniref:Heat-shock protein Hsp20 n=1 Tax=Alkalilimnicola ehrlichii TaxID=351052 RepID=A0A3E0X302_9GAMM|nr:Hsp20/alpha crystallin family protein [Alkalilimnicola ehrlichii]RFA28978.1 heat-shock protein Hsp20 [Alkalilimnicola ehrlichii]RFA38614.1 heat-shock protein Hsp20 [Alkalilimnicola ehrlichii]
MAKEDRQQISSSGEPQRRGLQRARPVRSIDPLSEMERLFDEYMPSSLIRPFRFERPGWMDVIGQAETRMPRVDVLERDKEIMMKAEIPGVDKDDLDVSVTDNTVTIKATTKHEQEEEEGDYYRCEISRGSYARTIALPSEVDASQAKAKFDNGVLEMTLPKKEAAKRQKITVE